MKLCCVGDVMFTTPLVRTIRKGFPRAKIVYLVGNWAKEVIETNPNIDDVFIFNIPLEKTNKIKKFIGLIKSILILRKEKFDLAINCHRSLASNFFLLLIGCKYRIGFNWKNRGLFLTKKISFDYKKHEVERYLDIARGIGLKPDDGKLEIELLGEEKRLAEELIRKINPEKKKMVSVFPGGGVNPGTTMLSKRWPVKKFAVLCDWIIEKYNAIVLFLGGESDEEHVQKIISLMKNKPINLCSKLTYRESAAIIEKTGLFIGGDSGLLYIASALDTPTISIFGPSNPELVAPRGNKHIYVWKKIECSPCYVPETVHKREFLKCDDFKCMEAITVEEIKQAVASQWEKWVKD
ncbi:glycosyltransferase family 9 protein [Candidatus Aminicenantes bacterium AC-708-I09]|nr:glycosyltransferase family 9 protein [Candidatus Aminicenantes bacterium AC-708-I09]